MREYLLWHGLPWVNLLEAPLDGMEPPLGVDEWALEPATLRVGEVTCPVVSH